MEIVAVLTADVVDSRSLPPNKLDQLLSSTASELETELYGGNKTFIIYRGDSFQAVVDPALALRTALLWRAAFMMSDEETLRDIRVAIGIGELTYRGKDPGTSSGPVFEYSGLLLDEMKKAEVPRLQIRSAWDDYNASSSVNCYLAEGIMRRWSAAGASAIYYQLLTGETQLQLAKRFGIAQSSVNRRLSTSDWPAIQRWEEHYRTHITNRLNLSTP